MHLAALENSIFEEDSKTDLVFEEYHAFCDVDGNFILCGISHPVTAFFKKADHLGCGLAAKQAVMMRFSCRTIDRVAATKEVDQPWFGEISQIRR